MEEFKSNSYKSKEQSLEQTRDKRVEPVVLSTAKVKKKNGASKIADVFLSEDMNSVKDYILIDVLVPAVKKAISDIVTNGVEMILYGESGSRMNRPVSEKISYRDYNQYSRQTAINPTRAASNYSYNEIIFNTKGDAEAALFSMDELISTYGIVRVADLYDLANLPCEHTANKYGWYDIRSARVVPVRDGYVIKMPRAMVID